MATVTLTVGKSAQACQIQCLQIAIRNISTERGVIFHPVLYLEKTCNFLY